MNKEELKAKIDALNAELQPLEKQLREIYNEEGKETELKIKKCHSFEDKFEPEELLFSATARCSCRAGMAYPKKINSSTSSWFCSAVLLGEAKHPKDGGLTSHLEYPFAFYSIKSEDQPSAQGATTRPEIKK